MINYKKIYESLENPVEDDSIETREAVKGWLGEFFPDDIDYGYPHFKIEDVSDDKYVDIIFDSDRESVKFYKLLMQNKGYAELGFDGYDYKSTMTHGQGTLTLNYGRL